MLFFGEGIMRWIVCSVIALLASPAIADGSIPYSGQYEIVGDISQPGNALFYFSGGLISFPPVYDPSNPFAFVSYGAGITATVNGSYSFYTGESNCAGVPFAICDHGLHPTYYFASYSDTSRLFDITVSVAGNWPNDFALNYRIADGLDLVPYVAPIPEPSTWAMLLIGFAGIGFVCYRKSRITSRRKHCACLYSSCL